MLQTFKNSFHEFLESTTIHGLVYIATCKNNAFKLLWIIVVFISFVTAGYLIHDSFASWSRSPVISSVSTYPIEDVDFPDITVCPPKDSNTILNHGIITSDQIEIDNATRQELIKFTDESADNFFQNWFIAGAEFYNADDIKAMFKGFVLVSSTDNFGAQKFLSDILMKGSYSAEMT